MGLRGLLAYAVALILVPFVLIAAEVVGSGPGWVTGQGSLPTIWAAYVVSMWWAPLPSLGLGALFGLALAPLPCGAPGPGCRTWVRSLGSARSAASSTWRSVDRGHP